MTRAVAGLSDDAFLFSFSVPPPRSPQFSHPPHCPVNQTHWQPATLRNNEITGDAQGRQGVFCSLEPVVAREEGAPVPSGGCCGSRSQCKTRWGLGFVCAEASHPSGHSATSARGQFGIRPWLDLALLHPRRWRSSRPAGPFPAASARQVTGGWSRSRLGPFTPAASLPHLQD